MYIRYITCKKKKFLFLRMSFNVDFKLNPKYNTSRVQ